MALDPITLAHQSPDAASFERAVLDELAREVGFEAAFFATHGETPTTVALDTAALIDAFSSRRYQDEVASLKRHATRGVVVDTMHATEAEVRRRRYHRDFAAPIRGRHTLLAPIVVRDRVLGGLMLGRTGATFPDAALARIAELLPAIALGRASFFLPWRASPLARSRGWLGRIGVAQVRERAGELVVRDRGRFREMVRESVDGDVVWTRASLDGVRSGWFYVELFHLAAARARQRRSALFLGAGGGVAMRQFAEAYPGIAIDVVDLDPRVLELARDWFGLGAVPALTAHVGDAADFVHHAHFSRWDVVVVDAFTDLNLPRALLEPGFFRDLSRILRPGGAVAFNTIGALGTGVVRDVERLARSAFDDVRLVPVLDEGEDYDPGARRNVVVLGSRR